MQDLIDFAQKKKISLSMVGTTESLVSKPKTMQWFKWISCLAYLGKAAINI